MSESDHNSPSSESRSPAQTVGLTTDLWLNCPRSAYLVGICGSGMKALAEVLLGQDWQITGSDSQGAGPQGEILRLRGARVFTTHSARNIPAGIDVLIYSSAIPADNSERAWADDHGVPQFAYHEMLGALMAQKIGISIAGTHGKSTTTALTGCILDFAGLAPTVIVGAEICGQQVNGKSGTGPHLVAESCEYRRHFLNLRPKYAAILGIEADHFDCFDGVEATTRAFQDFAKLIPADGLLVIHQDCRDSRHAADFAICPVETIALSGTTPLGKPGTSHTAAPATWTAVNIEKTKSGHSFQVLHDGVEFCACQLPIPGRHHLLNALAATALSYRAGATAEQIASGIGQFRGIRRRFEVLGEWRGVTLVDDYAHHPTAIRATLKTAREQFPARRIVCVFQPHQVSRTLGLLHEFASSFSDADEVHLVPVFGAREAFQQELSEVSRRLVDLILAQGVSARFNSSLDQTWTSLEDTLQPQDVLLTLGAGDIDRIHSQLHGLG